MVPEAPQQPPLPGLPTGHGRLFSWHPGGVAMCSRARVGWSSGASRLPARSCGTKDSYDRCLTRHNWN